MSNIFRFLVFTVLSVLSITSWTQNYPDPHELQELMLGNWDRIEDYEVDIKLALDIPGFRMPSRKIHYLYKSPDKSKVEVKGFAIIPKQGIQPFFTFFKDSLALEIVNDSLVNGKEVFELTLEDTFMNQAGRINFLVDPKTGNISDAWVIHDGHEFFRITSQYGKFDDIYLPTSTKINMTFPPDFQNIQRLGKRPTEMRKFETQMSSDWIKGSISIEFKNYKVNRGIPDYRFEDEAEETIQD